MNMEVKSNSILNEKIYVCTLPIGAKCYIIPKSGFKSSQAMISFNYGSADLKLLYKGKKYLSPKGTAHFIEHKIFEKKDKNYFTYFTSAGANTNAFTDFNKTAYYFSSTNNFYEHLKSLVEMVETGYFEEKSVEREKGIIGQEISMYEDNPAWIVYFNMLENMFKDHPIKYSIAGKEEDIKKISAKSLEMAYNNFYTPKNMNIVVCGNVEVEKVMEVLKSSFSQEFKERKFNGRIYNKDIDGILNKYVCQRMGLGTPIFNIGFKHCVTNVSVEKIYAMKMLLDILVGESSYLFGRLQNTGYCNESLGFQYVWHKDVSMSIITGQAREPRQIGNAIIREIERTKELGICQEVFERVKKKQIGRFIRGFNSVEAITMAQTEISNVEGADLFVAFDAIRNMEKEYLEELLLSFDKKSAVLSVVR